LNKLRLTIFAVVLVASSVFARSARPITVFTIREAVNLNQGQTDMEGNPLPVLPAPKLLPFTRPQFRSCVGAWVAIHPRNPALGQQTLWMVSFEWPTTKARQYQIRQKLRAARDADGKIWLQRATTPTLTVDVTEYEPGETPEDPPVPVVVQRTLRWLAMRHRMAGIDDDDPADIEEDVIIPEPVQP